MKAWALLVITIHFLHAILKLHFPTMKTAMLFPETPGKNGNYTKVVYESQMLHKCRFLLWKMTGCRADIQSEKFLKITKMCNGL